ncbi:MATE family efflux transporter [Halosquirtibacter xylanolyticus]|uniref:MATE family efflux transporter n=1 Tax=Halosquirtibacter xylanolyticus TaxID=3374599 RepID=UPI0037491503|nr:MATE family efflux transporter [Prolixibacteraceae bacterium]
MNQTQENFKRISVLAVPLVLSQVGQIIVTLADNAMVGHVGKEYLAASSFANSIFMIIMMFGMGITFGLTPLVGKAFGEKDMKTIQKLFHNSLFLNTIFTIILIIVGTIAGFLMPYMGQTELVVSLAQPYYFIILASLIPMVYFFSIKQLAEGMENTKIAMILTVTGNLMNVFGNYILIYGKFGTPKLYLDGAGISTFISRLFMMIAFFIVFKKSSIFKPFSLTFKIKEITRSLQKQLFGIGSAIGLQMLVESFIFSLGAIMMGWISELYLAAHQIAMSLSYFTFMISNGIAQATTIRISTLYGRKEFNMLKSAINVSLIITFVYSCIACVIFLTIPTQLVAIFTNDESVVVAAASLLGMAAIYQIFDGLQVLGLGVLRGFADVKTPMIYATTSYLLVGIPLGYIAAFKFDLGAYGIWTGIIAGLGLAALLFWTRVLHRRKTLTT